MSKLAENLPNDPAVLKAMIAALQAENAKMAITLWVHDQLVQTLRLRIAKLQKLVFSSMGQRRAPPELHGTPVRNSFVATI